MFNNKDQLLCRLKPGTIAENSDYAWLIFFGKIPQYGERFHSPFRSDRHPGCRWAYYHEQWYLVDNKGYDNKIAWSIYDFVSWLNPALSSEQVYNLICYKLTQNIPNIVKTDRRPNIKEIQESNIVIKFEYKEWTEDAYFCSKFDIPPDYMNQQPYYLVTDYWCNSRKDNIIKKNPFYNPKRNVTIAYHFESDNVKLYWPNISRKKMRWYSNANANDFFGEHRIPNYKNHIVITKSGKDDIVLNYHYGLNTIGVQNEAINQNTKLLQITKGYKTFVWYDNDETGRTNGEKLAEYLEAVHVVLPENCAGKDPAEIFKNDKETINKIRYEYKIME